MHRKLAYPGGRVGGSAPDPDLPGPFSSRLEAEAGWRERGRHGALRGLLREGRRQGRGELGGRGGGLHGRRGAGCLPAGRGASSSHPRRVHDPHAHAGRGQRHPGLAARPGRQAPVPTKRPAAQPRAAPGPRKRGGGRAPRSIPQLQAGAARALLALGPQRARQAPWNPSFPQSRERLLWGWGVTHSSQVEGGGEAGRGRGSGSIRLEQSTDQQGHLNIHPFCHLGVREHRTDSGLPGQPQDVVLQPLQGLESRARLIMLWSVPAPDSTSRREGTQL